jgi:hypothetical protein
MTLFMVARRNTGAIEVAWKRSGPLRRPSVPVARHGRFHLSMEVERRGRRPQP